MINSSSQGENNMAQHVLVLVGILAFVALAIASRHRVRQGAGRASGRGAQVVVSFDDGGISADYPDGQRRAISWEDLSRVGVTTTDEGPFVDDVFIGLHDRAGELVLVYPQGAAGDQAILVEMQRRLPGFDNRLFVKAMGSTSNAHFLLWEKPQEKVMK